MTRRLIRYNMFFELGPKRNFWRSYGHLKKRQFVWWLWHKSDMPRQNYILVKNDPTNKFLNFKNRLIVFRSSSSTKWHPSTRSCYNIYSRLWGLSVPTFRILEDFRGFWLGTCNMYPCYPAKNLWDFPMKIFFFQKSKIGHGGPTQNRILRRTTVIEFSKTFLVLYKWPDLTDVQGILCSTVRKSSK
jgi:hypothetical protein